MMSLRACVLTGALCGGLMLYGCSAGAPKTPDAPDPVVQTTEPVQQKEVVAGGWTENTEWVSKAVTDEQLSIFHDAAGGILDVSYEPIAVVGQQVVAGMNYAYLCQVIDWEGDATPHWCIVTVYHDLEGGSKLVEDKPIDVSDVKTADTASHEATGAWSAPEPNNGMLLPEQAQQAFAKAMESYGGTSASPVALLGTQVVAGTNYRVLAQGPNGAGATTYTTYVVDVYQDLEGNCSVTNMAPLDLAYYVTRS